MKKKIIDAFKEPVKNHECTLNLLIGGVITLFPVINFISLGFLATRLENSIDQLKVPVKWENTQKLFIKGAKIFAISAVYLVLPVLFALLGGFLILNLAQGKILSLFYLRGQMLNIIGTLLLLVSLYLLPLGVCLFLESKNIRKAFDIKEIIERIILIPREYTLLFAIMITLLVVSAIIILFLMNWRAATLLGGFIIFYDSLVITNLLCKFFPRKSININLG
ncbi:MAG TPA: DUF4013 domain-containing protein [bacterium]|nr:DUF4013 domain-containing protein [bacterium]